MGKGDKANKFASGPWYQGPKSRLEFAGRGKEKESVANIKTAVEFSVIPPIFKALGGIAKGSKLLGGLASKFFNKGKKISTLTTKGVRNIPAYKFKGVQVYRAEDAYIGQKGYKIKKFEGSGTTTHNWWTRNIDEIKDTYLPHVKDAALQGRSREHMMYLPPGSLKRGMVVNLSNKMFKRFSRPLTDPTTTAHRLSGGVGRVANLNEIVIPKAITERIRKGAVPYAEIFVGRTSKEMMRQFNKKRGFGL